MVEHKLSRVRPKLVDYVLAAVPFVVIAGVALRIITSPPETHPELLPQLAGCYIAAFPHKNLKLRLDVSGVIATDQDNTRFQIIREKTGMTIQPDRLVEFDTAIGGGKIALVEGHPLFLRLNADLTGFNVPNLAGPDLDMHRTSC